MEHRDCIYKTLLPYLLVASRFRGFNFARRLIELFPFYRIDGPANLRMAVDLLDSMSVHDDARRPVIDELIFRKFLTEANYVGLNSQMENEAFLEFLFDTNTRSKVDAMAMSHVFMDSAIIKHMKPLADENTVTTYLKHFADFSKITERVEWVDMYVFDDVFKPLFQQVLLYNDNRHILTLLGLAPVGPERSALAEIDSVLNIIEAQVVKAQRSGNAKELQSWLKFKLSALEKRNAMQGGGGEISAESMLDALNAPGDYQDPKIYSVEELGAAATKDGA